MGRFKLKVRYTRPHVEIEAQRRTLQGLEGVHVERDGAPDDLVEQVFPQPNFAVKQHRLIGLALVPPKLATVGDSRGNEPFSVLVLMDQPDMGVEEPIHLVPQPCVCFAVAAVDPQGPHELRERVPQDQLAALGPHGLSRNPRQQQAGQVAEGQLVLACPTQDQLVRTIHPACTDTGCRGWCGAVSTAPSSAP